MSTAAACASSGRGVAAEPKAEREKAVSDEEYNCLIGMSDASLQKGDFASAAKSARLAIALIASAPAGHRLLGLALESSDETGGAIQAYVRCMAAAAIRGEDDCSDYAGCALDAFALLLREDCAGEPRPGWWNEPALRALSANVVKWRPTAINAWLMRAAILMRAPYLEQVDWRPDTPAEEAADLREAGRCYQQAAKLATERDQKEEWVRLALDCLRDARSFEEGA
jgi:hypothetical protein